MGTPAWVGSVLFTKGTADTQLQFFPRLPTVLPVAARVSPAAQHRRHAGGQGGLARSAPVGIHHGRLERG